MIRKHLQFRNKTLKEIRWWAWLAVVMPISALAGFFFIWAYGTKTMVNIAMIIGSTTMFIIAVIWWWWALHAIKTLISHWDETASNVKTVAKEIRDLRSYISEIFQTRSDK